MKNPVKPPSSAKAGALTRLEALDRLENDYLPGLRAAKSKLPASVDRPDVVSMRLVAAESKVPHDYLNREGEECRRLVKERLPELGLEVRLPARENESHTLKDWKDIVIVRTRDACKQDGRKHEKECATFEKTFELMAGLFRGKVSVPARAALTRANEAVCEKSGGLSRPHIVRHLAIAQRYLVDAEQGIGSPDTFHGRLRFELALVGMSPWSLGKLIEVPRQTVLDLAEGRKQPGSAMALPFRRAEKLLRLPAGVFVSLIAVESAARGIILNKHLPAGLTRYEQERLKQRLPEDYSRRHPEEREFLLCGALRQIEEWEQTPEAKRAKLRADKYAFTKWPKHLEAEWQNIVAARRPQRLPLGTMAQKTGWKSEHTIGIWRSRYAQFFGFLTNRLDELAKVSGYEDRGPFKRLRPDQLSFALLTQDALVTAFMSWLIWRKECVELPALHTHTAMEFEHERLRLTRKLPERRWGATA
jgi:hypothetical protein